MAVLGQRTYKVRIVVREAKPRGRTRQRHGFDQTIECHATGFGEALTEGVEAARLVAESMDKLERGGGGS